MSQQLIRLLMDITIIGGLTKQLIKIHFNNNTKETIYSVPLKSI
jgi:hypothetical protein